jgi:hypothetical protein
MSEPIHPHSPSVSTALWNIRIDAAIVEVVESFDGAGIRSIVLKGPALAELYPERAGRTYVDGDIWVAPGQLVAAGGILSALGFVPKIDESRLPDWWLEHASSWRRESDRAAIDLHRNLQGVRADPQVVWDRLWEQRNSFEVHRHRVFRLSDPARMLYVVLHAAHDGPAGSRALVHLDRALAHTGEETWRHAAALARELDAVDAFGAGLRLLPDGAALAQRLDLPTNNSVDAALKAVSAPPVALGFAQLASASSWWTRLRIAALKFFPPPGFIRHWWPPAARNSRMLAVGYLYRPVWLLRRAPAGWRAWRSARRSVH